MLRFKNRNKRKKNDNNDSDVDVQFQTPRTKNYNVRNKDDGSSRLEETITDKVNTKRKQKKYPKKRPKRKKAKLVVRTAVINDVETPTEDIPSDVSQWNFESDNSDSDSKYNEKVVELTNKEQNEVPRNVVDNAQNEAALNETTSVESTKINTLDQLRGKNLSTLLSTKPTKKTKRVTEQTSETSKHKKKDTTQPSVRVTRRSVKNSLPPSRRTRSKC